MTIVAVTAARYVCRVFAACRDAVMAGAAGAENLCVVYGNGRLKGNGVVAVLTRGCGGYMRWWGTRGNRIIVAGFTGREDPAVVETCAYPAFSSVAIITYVAAGDVLGMLARCATPVMAQITFKRRTLEQAACMAA